MILISEICSCVLYFFEKYLVLEFLKLIISAANSAALHTNQKHLSDIAALLFLFLREIYQLPEDLSDYDLYHGFAT